MGVTYTIIGVILIFAGTTLGSSLVYLFKSIKPTVRRIISGFASGVMLAASIFSLIIPSLNDTTNSYLDENLKWIIVVASVLLGFLFLFILDKVTPHIHQHNNFEEGVQTSRIGRGSKLFLAVTLHNIPEGLSIGLSFGVALATKDMNSPLFLSALMLAIGMTIQNFPEGAAISLPLLEEGYSRNRAFVFGTLSGAVEPIAAVLGILIGSTIQYIMPWALSFSAGCMIYVIIEELIPDSQNGKSHFGTWAFIFGFLLMMVLDTAL